MADSPVRLLVKIGDPTTAANEASVSASGELTALIAGAALTALQLIDDPVEVLGTATYSEATTAGMVVGVVRNDVLATLASLDNEIAPLQVNADGALYVDISDVTGDVTVSGAALTALQLIDDSIFTDNGPFTLAASEVTMAGAIRDDALSALAAAENDAVPLRVNVNGALHVTGGGGGTEFNEDTAHGTGEAGSMIFAVRRDANTTLVDSDNDYAPLQVDVDGKLKVEMFDGGDTLTVAAHAVTNAGTFLVQEDGAALTALQLIDDMIYTDDTDTHSTGSSKGAGVMAVAVPTDAAIEANDIGMLAMSLDRRLHVDADIIASVALTVDLGANNDVTIEGGAVVGTDGGAGPADCLSIGGTEAGGNIQEILVDSAGAVSVNVLTGGGSDTPAGEVAVRATASDVAVDATLNVDEAEAGGTTSKCTGFDASASVPIKAELQQVDDNSGTAKVTLFAAAGEPIHWRAPRRDYFETAFSANAGFDGWRVVITNKDSTDAADLYGTIYTEN